MLVNYRIRNLESKEANMGTEAKARRPRKGRSHAVRKFIRAVRVEVTTEDIGKATLWQEARDKRQSMRV